MYQQKLATNFLQAIQPSPKRQKLNLASVSSPNQTLATGTAAYSKSTSASLLFQRPPALLHELTHYKLSPFKDFGHFNEVRLNAVVRGQIVGISRFDYSARPIKNYKEIFNIDLFDGTDIVRIIFYDDVAREFVSLLKEGESFEIRKPVAVDMAGLKEKSSLSKQFRALYKCQSILTCHAVDKIFQLTLGDVIGTI